MGTRGAYGFRVGGTDKVTYNHFDSYPDSLGVAILSFLRDVGNDELRDIAERIELVDETTPPTRRQINMCQKAGTVNLGVSGQSTKDWYCLLRNAQGDLGIYRRDENGMAPLPFMIDSHQFLIDSLFCEWAYIINLDTGMLEIYRGFNKNRDAKGRFCKRVGRYASCQCDDQYYRDNHYYGVQLIWEMPLRQARRLTDEDFIREVNRLAGRDEE